MQYTAFKSTGEKAGIKKKETNMLHMSGTAG
jgi:hypothetical protein